MKSYATINGFEYLTAQQVFDMSAKHLLKQQRRSGSASYLCRYRGDNGTKCAAGVFLKDKYASACEGMSWASLDRNQMVPINNSALVASLQLVHDVYQPEDWHSHLRAVARMHKLEYKF